MSQFITNVKQLLNSGSKIVKMFNNAARYYCALLGIEVPVLVKTLLV